MTLLHRYAVCDESDIAAVKREISALCFRNNFSKRSCGDIDLIVIELVTNLLKHKAIKGEILAELIFGENEEIGIEIQSVDKGPGIKDVNFALKDHTSSTKGSMGVGLGSVRRLSDEFSIKSCIEGTTIKVKKFAGNKKDFQQNNTEVSVFSRVHPLETLSGDGFFIRNEKKKIFVAVIDGLGHGPSAHEATNVAEKILGETYHILSLEEIFEEIHSALRSTRGAVMSIARIDEVRGTLDYAGVGDVNATIFPSSNELKPINLPGVLGITIPKIKVFSYNWQQRRNTLIIFSDGISSKFSNEKDFEKLRSLDIADRIIKNYWKMNDDATVVVVK